MGAAGGIPSQLEDLLTVGRKQASGFVQAAWKSLTVAQAWLSSAQLIQAGSLASLPL